MSELERLEGFTKDYVELVNKYKLCMTSCCCITICDSSEMGETRQELFGMHDFIDSADLNNVGFKYRDGQWVKR